MKTNLFQNYMTTDQRKLEDMIGEPGGKSTPVPSPDKSKNCGYASDSQENAPRTAKKVSRFDVKKVSEDREAAGNNLPPPNENPQETQTIASAADAETAAEMAGGVNGGLRKDNNKNRSRSMSIEAWRVAAEEEHYDSSPSPVSCYDTASESGPYGNEILPGMRFHSCIPRVGIKFPVVLTIVFSHFTIWVCFWPRLTDLTVKIKFPMILK